MLRSPVAAARQPWIRGEPSTGVAGVPTTGAGAQRSATAFAAAGNALAAPSIRELSIDLMRSTASRNSDEIGSLAGCPPYEVAELVDRSQQRASRPRPGRICRA